DSSFAMLSTQQSKQSRTASYLKNQVSINLATLIGDQSIMNETAMPQDTKLSDFLTKTAPYRMHAVEIFRFALRLRSEWAEAPPMEISVGDKLVVEGNLNAFTNPAIEAGVIHSRALLQFLGLCCRNNKLCNIKGRKDDDIGIEHFADKNGPLAIVSPDEAISRYQGERIEAEKALLNIFRVANKGLAHITQDFIDHPESGTLLDIASRGIPSLVISHLFTPLGLPAPNYKISSRARTSCESDVAI
ncbi:MAG: hypothetical protein WCO71_11535, partial [Pseudomonadota bacterium]